VDDAVEVREESVVEAELGELADELDQAALEELLLEQAPAAQMTGEPVIEEIELEQLLPFDADPTSDTDIGLLLEVPLSISVELGRTSLTIRELLALGQGSILQLDATGEPVDVLVNGKPPGTRRGRRDRRGLRHPRDRGRHPGGADQRDGGASRCGACSRPRSRCCSRCPRARSR